MKNPITYLLVLVTLLSSSISLAQKVDPETANEHFKFGNYLDAYEVYQELLLKSPNNPEFNYRAGYSLLSAEGDHSDAIAYLEKAVQLNANEDAEFYLAKAYHSNLMLEKALSAYINYKKKEKGSMLKKVDQEIQYVKNAQQLITKPLNVTFENIGDNINSEYPDYFPLITPKESFMVFTSRRKNGTKEFDGYYPSSIYYSKVVNGEFTKTKKGSPLINSTYDDQAVGLSYNADKLFIYFDDIKNAGDIYEADILNFRFKKKVKMDESVNSKGFESSATISMDGNTLFFASVRSEGLGGKDIYMTRKLPNGAWALPQNLGPNINTELNEDFPNLFFDGRTLYFSSQGHNSMGGYDYFKSTWNPVTNEWSKAENLGYPLNTPRDNLCISFTEDKAHAYVSCWLKDSQGFQDIYKVNFEDVGIKETVIRTQVVCANTAKIIKNAFIVVKNDKTNKERNYTPNSINGGVIITLPEGKYTVEIEAPGYNFSDEKITIKGKSDFVSSMSKKFIVTPK